MNILIFGGTGFIGSALVEALSAQGDECHVVTRRANGLVGGKAQYHTWDGHDIQQVVSLMDSADAIVNLAGETIGKWPWSTTHKQRVIQSRVRIGQQIASVFTNGMLPTKKDRVYIQSSGVGYYGNSAQPNMDEMAPAGSDFLAHVAQEWEASTSVLDNVAGIRRCVIRTSLVLGRDAGALPMMALPVRFFAGGPLGDGNQGVSWIHIDDEVNAIIYLVKTPSCKGVFNFSAPQPVTNKHFMQVLARVLHRPSWLPAPAFALRLALGEMSTLLLDGQYAWPKALLDNGYIFRYPTIEAALMDLYKKEA